MCSRLPGWVAPAVFFAAAAVVHCLPAVPPGPMPSCEQACTRLIDLGCPEGAPSSGGVSCLEVCVTAVRAGVDLEPACVAQAADVASVRRCGVRCQQ